MLALTTVLYRLFTRQPSPKELEFHWWFVTEGVRDWHRFLAEKGFSVGRRTTIIRTQERTSRRILEVWDTQKFNTWGDREAPSPEVVGDDAVVPHVWVKPLRKLPRFPSDPSFH